MHTLMCPRPIKATRLNGLCILNTFLRSAEKHTQSCLTGSPIASNNCSQFQLKGMLCIMESNSNRREQNSGESNLSRPHGTKQAQAPLRCLVTARFSTSTERYLDASFSDSSPLTSSTPLTSFLREAHLEHLP